MEQSNNTQLPAEATDKIQKEASFYSGHNPDEDSTPFRNGYYSGYISGATEYATNIAQAKKEYLEADKALQSSRKQRKQSEKRGKETSQ